MDTLIITLCKWDVCFIYHLVLASSHSISSYHQILMILLSLYIGGIGFPIEWALLNSDTACQLIICVLSLPNPQICMFGIILPWDWVGDDKAGDPIRISWLPCKDYITTVWYLHFFSNWKYLIDILNIFWLTLLRHSLYVSKFV